MLSALTASEVQTMEDRLRDDIARLFSDYSAATGLSLTMLSEIFAGDRGFLNRLRRRGDASFRVRTFDMMAGRLASVWPDDVPWPQGVARVPAYPMPERTVSFDLATPDEVFARRRQKLIDILG